MLYLIQKDPPLKVDQSIHRPPQRHQENRSHRYMMQECFFACDSEPLTGWLASGGERWSRTDAASPIVFSG